MAMRPIQLVATFFRPLPTGPTDPLEKLIADNDVRGKKGLPPLCPAWLKKVLTENARAEPAG